MMKSFCLAFLLCGACLAFSQNSNFQNLLTAKELYVDGEFSESYSILQNISEGVDLNEVLYLKIMCLHKLYENSPEYAKELESYLSTYFEDHSPLNNAIYEYEDVVDVLLDVNFFRAKDEEALIKLSVPISGMDTTLYQNRVKKIESYLANTPNSYHRDSLIGFSQMYEDSLSLSQSYYAKIRLDSVRRSKISKVARFSLLELGYNVYPKFSNVRTVGTISDVGPFLAQGNNDYPVSLPDQSYDLSMFNIGINFPHTNRWKFSVLYSILSVGVRSWELDSISVLERPHERGIARNILNLNLGSKFGLMSTFLINPKRKLGIYYSINPAFSFFPETYSFTDEDLNETFVVSDRRNLIFRQELGVRWYMSSSFYLGICYQFGEYGWKTSLSENTLPNSDQKLSSVIPFELIGVRLGF